MGAKTALSVEQYLATSFPDLDKEYRDGELVERSLPDNFHSSTQASLVAFFAALQKTRSVFVRPELRMKIRSGLYVIPDVAVFHPAMPEGRYPDTPPLIAIEILSADDKLTEVREKLEVYRNWGVRHVWLVDPYLKRITLAMAS